MRPIIKYILWAAVLVGLAIAGIKYLSGEHFLRALQNFQWVYAPLLLGLSALHLALKGWRFALLLKPISDIPSLTLGRAYVAGQPATLIPGGVAARIALLKQVGVPIGKGTAPVTLSSLLDYVLTMIAGLLAAMWYEPARTPALIILAVLVFLGIVLAFPKARDWLMDAADWVARKIGIPDRWERFLQAFENSVTPKVLIGSIALTVVAFAIRLIILEFCFEGLGTTVSLAIIFLAYSLPTLLARLVPVPGGFGVTEASMVGLLVSMTSLDTNTAAAAVAIFRVSTILFEALLGALVYVFFWHGEDESAATS